jgi:putative FmdB family regulatory protein
MPTYDYECQDCGHTFELFQGINAPVETRCPKCEKETLKRLIGTGAAVVFKGSGFYQTDYRSEGYKKSAAADSKTSESKSSSGESSGDKSSTASPTPPKSSDGSASA